MSGGLEVVFFPIDFSRSEIDWVLDLINTVATDGHMDALVLVDTFGVVSPHAMKFFVRHVRNRFPGTRLETHFHQDFSLGVANTLLALAEGAEVVHSTVLGIGERAGNRSHRRHRHGPADHVRHRRRHPHGEILFPGQAGPGTLQRGCPQQPFHRRRPPVPGWNPASSPIGSTTAAWSTRRKLFPFRPEMVGQPEAEVVLGKGSGIDSVNIWLSRIGAQATEEEATEILMQVKAAGLQTKKLLTEEQFREIVARTVSRAA